MDEMDKKALSIVRYWIGKNVCYDPNYQIFIVWKAKIMQHWKYMISTTLDDRYYEVTYNGLYGDWYLDIYNKTGNQKYMDVTVTAEILKKVEL